MFQLSGLHCRCRSGMLGWIPVWLQGKIYLSQWENFKLFFCFLSFDLMKKFDSLVVGEQRNRTIS